MQKLQIIRVSYLKYQKYCNESKNDESFKFYIHLFNHFQKRLINFDQKFLI